MSNTYHISIIPSVSLFPWLRPEESIAGLAAGLWCHQEPEELRQWVLCFLPAPWLFVVEQLVWEVVYGRLHLQFFVFGKQEEEWFFPVVFRSGSFEHLQSFGAITSISSFLSIYLSVFWFLGLHPLWFFCEIKGWLNIEKSTVFFSWFSRIHQFLCLKTKMILCRYITLYNLCNVTYVSLQWDLFDHLAFKPRFWSPGFPPPAGTSRKACGTGWPTRPQSDWSTRLGVADPGKHQPDTGKKPLGTFGKLSWLFFGLMIMLKFLF